MHVRKTFAVLAAVLAVAAGTGAAAITRHPAPHPVTATVTVKPAAGGRAGWQGEYVYRPPAGLGSVFFHYPCPTGMAARTGGFSASDLARNLRMTTSSPRWDSGYLEWQWVFTWPTGAPRGDTIAFDVYCTPGPA